MEKRVGLISSLFWDRVFLKTHKLELRLTFEDSSITLAALPKFSFSFRFGILIVSGEFYTNCYVAIYSLNWLVAVAVKDIAGLGLDGFPKPIKTSQFCQYRLKQNLFFVVNDR